MKQHNPDNLTQEQITLIPGLRLLDENEVSAETWQKDSDKPAPCKRWIGGQWDDGWWGNLNHATYATTLTRSELRAARGLHGITENGERIPPIAGDKPCFEYDPAGHGAGVESDGHPQCASCGYPKSLHSPDPFAAESATPRTDAEEYLSPRYGDDSPGFNYVDADFARTLETELAAAQSDIERLKADNEAKVKILAGQQVELARVNPENARLRAEIERLTKERDGMVAQFGRIGEMIGDPLSGDFCQLEGTIRDMVQFYSRVMELSKCECDTDAGAIEWIEGMLSTEHDLQSVAAERDQLRARVATLEAQLGSH